MENVRSLSALWPLRQRRHAVVVCADDAREYEGAEPELRALGAALVVEAAAGPLSAALGRPSVTVADRFGSIGLHEERPTLAKILAALDGFELACPECGPQAWGDPGA